MTIVKLLTTLIIQLDFWNEVKNMILSPFKEPKIELVFVMLIIPFFVNILLFWVTDNFLMRNKKSYLGHHQLRGPSSTRPRRMRGKNILEKVKVKYKTKVTPPIMKRSESDSDLLSSEDDPIIQIHDTTTVTNRSSSVQSWVNTYRHLWYPWGLDVTCYRCCLILYIRKSNALCELL